MKRSGLALILAPLVGFLSSCEERTPNTQNSVQKTKDISECSTLEEILGQNAQNGYSLENDKDKIGLFNLNSANLGSISTLVIDNSINNCGPCRRSAEEIITYLEKNNKLYDSRKTGFVIIKEATEYFRNNEITSFPKMEIRKKNKEGRWESVELDEGKLGLSTQKLLQNVEHLELNKPIPPERVNLGDGLREYGVLFEKDDGLYVELSKARGAVCKKFGEESVCTYDLTDMGQFLAVLQSNFNFRVPKSWRENNDKSYSINQEEEDKYLTPDYMGDLNAEEQREFRKQQIKYQNEQIENTKITLSKNSKILFSLYNSALENSRAEYEGRSENYTFPAEFGERSKELIKNYLEKKGKSVEFERLKGLDENSYRQAEELDAVIVPHNAPIGYLESQLEREGNKIIFHFDRFRSDLKEEIGFLRKLKGSKGSKENNTILFLEKGDYCFGNALPDAGNSFIETTNILSNLYTLIEKNGRTTTNYSVDGLKEEYFGMMKEKEKITPHYKVDCLIEDYN